MSSSTSPSHGFTLRFAASLTVAAALAAGCTNPDHLPFAVELDRTTFVVNDAPSGAQTGNYASGAIAFASFTGNRYAIASVSLTPLDERPSNAANVSTASGQLSQLTLAATLIFGDHTQALAATANDGVLEASVDNVDTSASGLRFTVTAQDPKLTYYTRGVTGVTAQNLPSDIVILRALENQLSLLLSATPQVQAQIDAAGNATSDLNDFGFKYQDALDALEVANKTTSSALDQAKGGQTDAATQTMATARTQLSTAIDKLNVSRLRLLDVLAAIPKDASGFDQTIGALDQQSRHLAATAQIVAAHFYVVSHTFQDVPMVTLDVTAPATRLHSSRMAIDVSSSDDAQPSPLLHQYGHAVFASATGLPSITVPHQTSTTSTKQVAWREGFATFFAQSVIGSATYTDPTLQLTQDLDANTVDGKPVTVHGSDVEANVQAALWAIYKGASGAPVSAGNTPGLAVPFSQMWQCLGGKPDTFDDYVVCLKKTISADRAAGLDALLAKVNIP